jgi:hypothetical protein
MFDAEKELERLPKDEVRPALVSGRVGLSRSRELTCWPGGCAHVALLQDGFVDWAAVNTDELELPPGEDFGIETCVPVPAWQGSASSCCH